MDQFSWTIPRVADGNTRGLFQITQTRQATTAQHRIDRGTGHTEPAGHQMRPLPMLYAVGHHPVLHLGGYASPGCDEASSSGP